jgi:hypothetical protein
MPVAVISPQKQVERDPLDTLALALNVVNTVHKIKTDNRALEDAKLQRAEQSKKTGLESKALENQINGTVTPVELIKAGVSDIQDKPGKGLVGISIQTPEGPVVKYVKPKSGESPLGELAKGLGITKDKMAIAKAQKEAADPFNNLSGPDKEIVNDSAKKYSNTAMMKDSLDEVRTILADPNVPYEQKMIAAQGSLKLVNSASLNSPDVVGAEEARRAGAFLNPSMTNMLPGRAGPAFSPDLEGFTKQLDLIATGLGSKAEKLKGRIESATGAPLKSAAGGAPKAPPPPVHPIEDLKAERARRNNANAAAKK